MATKIVTKNSSTAGSAPSASDLVQGELAVNVVDKRLYTEDNAGNIVELGTNPSTIDINGGTIDGTVIGGTTTAAISGTTGQFSTSLNVDSTATMDGLVVGDTSAAYSAVFITSSTTGESELRMGDTDTDAGSISYTNSDDTMTFRASAGARMTLDSTGIDVTGEVLADGLTVEATTPTLTLSSPAIAWAGGESIGSLDWYTRDTSGVGPLVASRIYSYSVGSNSLPVTNLAFQTTTAGSALKTGILLEYNNDVSFYEDTGSTAKLTWSAADEDLNFADSVKATFGASDDLQIYHDGSNSYIRDTGTGNLNISADQLRVLNAGNNEIKAEFTTDGAVDLYHNNALKLATTSTGIDVTGQATMDGLSVDGAAVVRAGNSLTLNRTDNAIGGAMSYVAGTGFIFNDANGDGTSFNVGAANRMRIDTSGNVLVGTTTPNVYDGTTSGVALTQSGYIFAGKSGDAPLWLNRISNDGIITNFAKDGTTVGSIGTESGDLCIGSSASGHKGVRFGSSYIAPINTSNAFEDATTDLGLTAVRFKDLRLSGGVYLGGTGAANKLDDYEEGTWTPVIAGSGGGAYTYTASATARYTKIGNLVTLSAAITNITTNGGGQAGYVRIQGTPFSKSNSTFATGAIELSDGDMSSGQTFATVSFVSSGETNALYVRQSGDSSGGADFPVTGINSGTTDFNFTITYQTA